jgi:hypothetical protein
MVSKDAKKPALRRSLERMAQAILDLVRAWARSSRSNGDDEAQPDMG